MLIYKAQSNEPVPLFLLVNGLPLLVKLADGQPATGSFGLPHGLIATPPASRTQFLCGPA
jgi:hypothetical protein